jgi:hypothetical protein
MAVLVVQAIHAVPPPQGAKAHCIGEPYKALLRKTIPIGPNDGDESSGPICPSGMSDFAPESAVWRLR